MHRIDSVQPYAAISQIWLMFIISCYAMPLLAATPQPIRITDYRQAYPIVAQAEVLQSTAMSDEIGRYWNNFKPLKLTELTYSNSLDHVYWFRFTVQNLTNQHLYARLTNGGYSRAELYDWDGQQAHRLAVSGMDAPSPNSDMLVSSSTMPLNLPAGRTKTYLLRTQRLWVKLGPVVLYPEYSLLHTTRSLDIKNGLLLGFLLGAFLYVLVSFWLSREVSYGWLAAQILCQLLVTLVGTGLIPGYVELPDWLTISQLYYSFLALGGLASRQFQYTFLQLNRYGNRFVRVGYQIHLTGYLFLLGAAIFNQPEAFDLIEPFSFVGYVFVLYSDIVVYRNGYKPALYLFFTQSTAMLVVPLLFAQQAGIQTDSFDYILSLFVVIAFIGAAFTVGYKIRLYKEEAETLIAQQNQNLEQLVTERTEALQSEKHRADQQSERLKLALRELNHRVRNNLAVVSSLLKLQGNTIDPQTAREAFTESRQRVDAMALIHQQLYQSEEVTTIDVPLFITNLTQALSSAYGYTPETLQLELNLEPVVLPVEKAVPLGLLLNEVLTNAFKYGLSKTNHPCLAIKLRNDDVLLLDIADNGPGLDAVSWDSKTTSFGRRLIDGLTRQLNGQYTLSHEAGTRFDFRFPIPQDLPLFA